MKTEHFVSVNVSLFLQTEDHRLFLPHKL